MTISPLKPGDAAEAARLHIAGISTGFISSLGQAFVAALYESIATDDGSFGFVATENHRVVGFTAFTTDLSKLYRHVIRNRGHRFVLVLARKMLSVRVLKRVFDNLCYPSRTEKMNLPRAELLSIAVVPEEKGKGIGAALISAGFEECRKRGIDKVKVLVAAANVPANRLYQKAGFVCAGRIDSHGVLSNIYVAEIRQG